MEEHFRGVSENTPVFRHGLYADRLKLPCSSKNTCPINKKFPAVFFVRGGKALFIGGVGTGSAADGSAADGAKIVLVAPIAKGGRCPKVVYRVDAKRVESEFRDGSWSVYLLDTRKYSYDKDGNQVVTLAGLKPDGDVKLVNATSRVGDATLSAGAGENVSLATAVATTASTGTSLPADVPQPTISAIEVKGGNVYVTIENAVPYLAYDLTTGDTPDAVTESVDRPCTGSDDGTVVLVAPAKEGGAFFKVGRDEEGH